MMPRCIGLNKNNKKCRRKIPDGDFFCCESHQPLNNEILTEECFMCSEKVDTKLLWILKCNHAFHYECLAGWFDKLVNEEKPMECPICRREYRKLLYKKEKTIYDPNYYKSKLIDNLMLMPKSFKKKI